jgi:DNA primase
MKDLKIIHDLILEKLDFATVMEEYGVDFKHNPHIVSEVQLKCPFHGRDNKPSARLYKDTKSCFCWVCRKTWDVVSFIQEKEGMYYKQTLNYIPNRYHIDISSIPDSPTIEFKENVIEEKNVEFKHVRTNIISLRHKLPYEKYRALCAVFSIARYRDSCGEDVRESLNKIGEKLVCLNQSM